MFFVKKVIGFVDCFTRGVSWPSSDFPDKGTVVGLRSMLIGGGRIAWPLRIVWPRVVQRQLWQCTGSWQLRQRWQLSSYLLPYICNQGLDRLAGSCGLLDGGGQALTGREGRVRQDKGTTCT